MDTEKMWMFWLDWCLDTSFSVELNGWSGPIKFLQLDQQLTRAPIVFSLLGRLADKLHAAKN